MNIKLIEVEKSKKILKDLEEANIFKLSMGFGEFYVNLKKEE